jgi:actin-related protein 8
MPRGIPNAKRDDTGLKYTSYHVPLLPNPKQAGSSYLKSESQVIWNRDRPVVVQTEAEASAKRGSRVLVIHPGSRFLRIGRASDFKPVSIPNVVARKLRCSVNESDYPTPLQRISDENIDENIAHISSSLVDRMRFYHLRPTPRSQSTQSCSSFNERAKPEIIPEHNDPFRVAWVNETNKETIVGEAALKIPEPKKMGYLVRWPIYGHDFNTAQYNSVQLILSDIEAVIQHALQQPSLDVQPKDYSSYSVVLVIPDLYSRSYVNSMVNLLLLNFGFSRICVQQVGLTFHNLMHPRLINSF